MSTLAKQRLTDKKDDSVSKDEQEMMIMSSLYEMLKQQEIPLPDSTSENNESKSICSNETNQLDSALTDFQFERQRLKKSKKLLKNSSETLINKSEVLMAEDEKTISIDKLKTQQNSEKK